MSKILIIGGTRFFGKRLVEKLLQENHQLFIMTRGKLPTSFENKVTHLQYDRTNKEAVTAAIDSHFFDLVYDNVNYNAQDAADATEIFNEKTARYIFTSTLAVHDADGIPKSESDFSPYTYPIFLGERTQFTYGEGKRQSEAVFFQRASFPVVAVRFPIVMGEDDYTERLKYHIQHIQQKQTMNFLNLDAKMGFITSQEAADFLYWVGKETFVGPIQAASNGLTSTNELLSLIEKETGENAIISLLENDTPLSPYAIPKSWYMKTDYAKQLGFTFSTLSDWLPALIKKLL